MQRQFTVAGKGRYSLEADMWSVGVLLYVLLSGSYPFQEATLFDQIQHAQYSMNGEKWLNISNEAKDLIKKLIVVNPDGRLSAEVSLQHPWFHDTIIHQSQPDHLSTSSMDVSTTVHVVEPILITIPPAIQLPMLPPVGKMRQKRKEPETANNDIASPPPAQRRSTRKVSVGEVETSTEIELDVGCFNFFTSKQPKGKKGKEDTKKVVNSKKK